MTSQETPDQRVQTVWPIDALSDASYVNAITITSGPPMAMPSAEGDEDGSIYLVFGHLGPPMISGPEDIQKLGGQLQVQPRAALVMTTNRARELHALLGTHLSRSPQSLTIDTEEES